MPMNNRPTLAKIQKNDYKSSIQTQYIWVKFKGLFMENENISLKY